MEKSSLKHNLNIIELQLDKPTHTYQEKEEKLDRLSALMGLSSECVARANLIKATALKAACEQSIIDRIHNKYSATFIKNMIETQVADQQYLVDKADRLNKGLTHTMEALRSILSKYKEELKYSINQT